MKPYEAVYGQQYLPCISYLPGASKVKVVDRLLQSRATTLATLRDNLAMAQNRMKQHAYRHRS